MWQAYSNERSDVRAHFVAALRELGIPVEEAAARAERVLSDPNLYTPAECARALGLNPRGYRNT